MSDNPAAFRIQARRAGDGGVLAFNLPAAMSRALPDGGHIFDVSFTDDGILLVYVGPATSDGRKSGQTVETPKWVSDE